MAHGQPVTDFEDPLMVLLFELNVIAIKTALKFMRELHVAQGGASAQTTCVASSRGLVFNGPVHV